MSSQNYANHRRWYPPYHFIYLPAVLALLIWCAYCTYHHPEDQLLWMTLTVAIALLIFLSFLLRQHYALGNQDRLIRLELRLRYYQLTGQRLEPMEDRLSTGQLTALRFASDGELPALVQRAVDEKLSPDAIKRAVQQWQPDLMRL